MPSGRVRGAGGAVRCSVGTIGGAGEWVAGALGLASVARGEARRLRAVVDARHERRTRRSDQKALLGAVIGKGGTDEVQDLASRSRDCVGVREQTGPFRSLVNCDAQYETGRRNSRDGSMRGAI